MEINILRTLDQLSWNFTGHLYLLFKALQGLYKYSLKVMKGENVEIKMSDALSSISIRSPFSD